MAVARKSKIGPLHTSLFANLRFLMSVHGHSSALDELVSEDVFLLPNSNKKASNEVIHFVLKVWDKAKCAEKFKFCWPVLDRKQESQFQRGACALLQEIKAAHPEARLPTVSLALLLQPGGDKYCAFLLRLTTFLLSLALKSEDIETRPVIKKGQSTDEIKGQLKNLAEASLSSAVEAHANAEATFKGAEDFSRKLNDWWQSWEEREETALQEYRVAVEKLKLPQNLKKLLVKGPENIKDLKAAKKALRNEIEKTLAQMEGSEFVPQPSVASPLKDINITPLEMQLDNLETPKRQMCKGLKELQLILELAEKQEAWPLHSEASRLKEKMGSGQPAQFIQLLEDRLEKAKIAGSKQKSKRESIAPSPAYVVSPCKLRLLQETPYPTLTGGVSPSPFVPVRAPPAEEEESVESLLRRYYCPHPKISPPTTEMSPPSHQSPTTFASTAPVHCFKASPKSPTAMKFQLPKEAEMALTPPSMGEAAPPRGRRSYLDGSRDELPLGELSLLELAEMHFSLCSEEEASSPEPPPEAVAAPEEEDVKPDLHSLMQRLQAIKDRSKAMPSVLVKNELNSP